MKVNAFLHIFPRIKILCVVFFFCSCDVFRLKKINMIKVFDTVFVSFDDQRRHHNLNEAQWLDIPHMVKWMIKTQICSMQSTKKKKKWRANDEDFLIFPEMDEEIVVSKLAKTRCRERNKKENVSGFMSVYVCACISYVYTLYIIFISGSSVNDFLFDQISIQNTVIMTITFRIQWHISFEYVVANKHKCMIIPSLSVLLLPLLLLLVFRLRRHSRRLTMCPFSNKNKKNRGSDSNTDTSDDDLQLKSKWYGNLDWHLWFQ